MGAADRRDDEGLKPGVASSNEGENQGSTHSSLVRALLLNRDRLPEGLFRQLLLKDRGGYSVNRRLFEDVDKWVRGLAVRKGWTFSDGIVNILMLQKGNELRAYRLRAGNLAEVIWQSRSHLKGTVELPNDVNNLAEIEDGTRLINDPNVRGVFDTYTVDVPNGKGNGGASTPRARITHRLTGKLLQIPTEHLDFHRYVPSEENSNLFSNLRTMFDSEGNDETFKSLENKGWEFNRFLDSVVGFRHFDGGMEEIVWRKSGDQYSVQEAKAQFVQGKFSLTKTERFEILQVEEQL